MIDAAMLKDIMAKRSCSDKEAAEALNISPKTLENRLKNGDIGLDEANALIKLLRIERPELIFFPRSNAKRYDKC